jgi:RNA polymerase sigma-70 factor (ECF subfamily)
MRRLKIAIKWTDVSLRGCTKMSDDSSFDQLISQLQDGSQSAAADLFELYAARLISLARSRLSERLRPSVDPEDVVQSALRSFFVGNREHSYKLKNWESLWGLLTVITLRKCRRQVEHHYAARRDVRREHRFDGPNDDAASVDFFGREPGPEEAAMLTEVVERIMAELEPRERQILTLHLQGKDAVEIAQNMSRSKRTVERVLERVRRQLESWSKHA